MTDIKVRSLKGRDRQYKVADGRGLFLVITPTGSKYWRFRYRIADREKSLAIGIYPDQMAHAQASWSCVEVKMSSDSKLITKKMGNCQMTS